MKKSPKLSWALLAGSCLFITPAAAFSAQAEESALEEIIVSATRYERPLSEIGSSVSLISADDMKKAQTVFVQDILQSVPGLSLNQNGANGGVSSLRIRGASSAQTVVLIDGVQVNDVASPGGAFNFAYLDPNGIEKIEVLRGPQSILYGSDAIGGVVNIITEEGTKGLKSSLFLEGGSYNSLRGGGHVAGGSDRLTFSLSASASTTDGISKADENNGNSEKDGYRNISLHGKITGKISENSRLQLMSRYGNSRTEVDGFGPVDANNVDYSQEYLVAGRGFFDYLDGDFQNTLSAEYSTTIRRSEANNAPNPYGSYEGARVNFDYFGHYKMNEAFGLSFGMQHEQTSAKNISPQKFNIDSILSEVSFQGLAGLTVTAGLRYDDHNQYGGTTTPRITAAYFASETNTKIFANWGEGFKAPSLFQLTYICYWCGLSAPNAALKPEESQGWEVGFEQALKGDRLHFGVTYFNQKMTNMIDFDFAVGYGNIASVQTKGLEITLDAQLLAGLSVSGNYTFTNATDKTTGQDLVRVPRHAAFAEIQWQATDAFGLGLTMTYNGKETDPYTVGTRGWVRFDLKAAYQINDRVEVYGRIDNLLNKQYQQVFGYGTPNRSFYAGIRGKF